MTLFSVQLTLVLTFCFLPFVSSAQSTRAPEVSYPGPITVVSAEYRLEPKIDGEVLPNRAIEIWAHAYWPSDLTQSSTAQKPIIVLLHGNHATCVLKSDPEETNCEYTRKGQCEDGYEVIRNHEGMGYLGQQLASHGYFVLSVNANRGITCGKGQDGDSGLILARGRLILRHLQLWKDWSSRGGVPESLGVPPRAFINKLDFSNVGLLGHSRGGEGVRAAYNLFKSKEGNWNEQISGLNIRGVFEIGSVDGQSSRVLDADSVAWNQLLPLCDGDITNQAGRKPFERMITKTNETRKTPKSLYMVWGANHNFFNSEWPKSDSIGCLGHEPIFTKPNGGALQRKIAALSATSFFLANVGTNRDALQNTHFNPIAQLPRAIEKLTQVTRDHIPTYDHAFALRIDDFDQPTGVSSNGNVNSSGGIEIENQSALPKRARISWEAAGPNVFLQLNFARSGHGQLVGSYQTLDLRVGRQQEHAGSTEPTNFHVHLIGPNDEILGAVLASDYAQILGPASQAPLFQTVRVPLSAFNIDSQTKVRGVRLSFDVSNKGKIHLANVRFSVLPPAEDQALMPRLTSTSTKSIRRPIVGASLSWQPPKITEYTGRIVQISKARDDEDIHRKSARGNSIEITVESEIGFPVGAELPTLVIAGRKFTLSELAEGSGTKRIIFTLPYEKYRELPESGPMHVQYGERSATRFWRLPEFVKQNPI